MSKSLLPSLKPLITHELQRMRPIIQAHKRLLSVSSDANLDIDRYIDVAVRVISDALEKENVAIPSELLRAEIAQEYSMMTIKDVTGLNPFTMPTKTSSLEEATGVLIEEPSPSSVSMASDGGQLKGVPDIPGFILKTNKEIIG